MTASILDTIKSKLGTIYDEYNEDILIEINAAIAVLTEVGVGPKSGFVVESEDETWDQFVTDKTVLSLVKQYIWTRCKISFDPPQNSFTLEALKEQAEEYLWRLNIKVDPEEQVFEGKPLWED